MNGSSPLLQLRELTGPLRLFFTAFLVVLTAGYAIGLLFVDHATSVSPAGIAEQYRGSPENAQQAELKYAKTEDEMYIFLHNHILSLSLVFFAVGGIFYLSSVRQGLKTFLMAEPFIALVTTFGGIWLTRYVSAYFSWLTLISGILMVGSYLAMVAVILYELWARR